MNTVAPLKIQVAYRCLYKNHGSSIGYWEAWVEEPGIVTMQHAKTLEGQAVRSEYVAQGKNIGRANETSPMQQAVLELESRTKKKLDKGYVLQLGEASAPATNALGLPRPMLATPIDKVRPESIDWESAFVQPKLDGHRAMYKDGMLYSREGKEIHMPHIVEAIKKAGLDDLHLDGELYIHGKTLQQISSLVKRHQEGSLDIEYHIFDIVSTDRFVSRAVLLLHRSAPLFEEPGKLALVTTVPVNDMEDVLAHHNLYRDRGYEGTMLRVGDKGYEDGKRSRNLLKIKEFHDDEFTVVGVEEGKPYVRADGVFQVPIWICEASNGEKFNVVCQGDMHEKHDFWANRAECIGRKLTVKYHYLSKDGIPQLPVALRFHETI